MTEWCSISLVSIPRDTLPTMFTPKFNSKVKVTCSIEGVKDVQVNPQLCLMPESAAELSKILTEQGGCTVTGYDADPAATGGPFSVTSQVPWFTIQYSEATPDVLRTITANFNAATLAMWWVRVADNKTALMYCLKEINAGLSDAFANQG